MPTLLRPAYRGVYRLGDWPAPFGIVLVVDRLSALMLLLTSILASAAVVFSLARWHRAGAHFHSLFQFLLMGLNGAFLTGDLFNLFVFFELLLAASYGLALHGSGPARVKAGLHYIVVNLAASLLFLIGVSLIYGVTGTLNMADLATRIPHIRRGGPRLAGGRRRHPGVAFLVKAGMWPLCFWLPTTYAAASAARGVHLRDHDQGRVPTSCCGSGCSCSASRPEHRRSSAATGCCSAGWRRSRSALIGTLASQDMARLAAFSVLVSSGTVLAAIGMGQSRRHRRSALLPGQLDARHQRVLPAGRTRRARPRARSGCARRHPGGLRRGRRLDGGQEVGIAIPATMGVARPRLHRLRVIIAGLPPLSGFIAKFALLTAALKPQGGNTVGIAAWTIAASSSSVGGRASAPMTDPRIVPWPTRNATFRPERLLVDAIEILRRMSASGRRARSDAATGPRARAPLSVIGASVSPQLPDSCVV